MHRFLFDRKITLLFLLLFGVPAFAATLTLTTKYGATGGLRGNLNAIGNEVNGRVICTQDNTNVNIEPGCDMFDDPGYVAGGNTPDDDSYTGDLVVRTNDNFELIAAWSWLGNVGEDEVTISSTLPAGTNFVFDGIPGACDQTLSTLSADQKTINCVRTGFDTNDVGSYAEDFAFAVRVEGDALNGDTPGPLSISIDDVTGTDPQTDATENTSLVITAAPRWNIQKSVYTVQAGRQNAGGDSGWHVWYKFYIEVDEVTGETDSPINPALGNEALSGGANATVTFTDDLTLVSPNAQLVTWSTDSNFAPIANACDMDSFSNDSDPFPAFNAANPERSIQIPAGVMGVTCTQTGSSVAVTVSGIDGTLSNPPTHNRFGNLLPVNRNIAAIGVIRVFIPLQDVIDNGGSLATTNCVADFDPDGVSAGSSNFGANTESPMDNCRSITLNASSGFWDKQYRKGWSDRGAEQPKWGGGAWSLPPTDASLVESGDGTVTADGVWGTYTNFTNNGGSPFTNMTLCDVIDVETYEMTVIDPANDYGTVGTGVFDQSIHAVDLLHSTTELNAGISIEYATGYVGSWPPDPTVAPSAGPTDELVDECSALGIVWHTTMAAAQAAAAGAPVSKVRVSVPSLEAGRLLSMRIKHTARSTFLTSGLPIPNDTLLINHATYTRDGLTGTVGGDGRTWRAGDYIALDATQAPPNGGGGDRLIFVTAKARILKEMNPGSVSIGDEVTVTLSPSLTSDSVTPVPGTIVIADLLPAGMNYNFGSTTGTFGAGPTPYGEPLAINPTTDADCTTHVPDIVSEGFPCGDTLNGGDANTTILVWDLGMQQSGIVMNDLVFTTTIAIDAQPIVLQNYTQISSTADTSASSQRVANANVSNSVPSSLLIVKEVLTPLNEINSTPAANNWMDFRIGLRNGSTVAVTALDFIDILPFNGDGVMGSFTFSPDSGTTVPRNRTPASNFSGTLEFDSVSFDDNGGILGGGCDVTTLEFWYTRNAGPLDISPRNTVLNDTAAGTSNWCQGTAAGPGGCDGGDGAITNADVTAFRIIGPDFAGGATCFVNVTYATAGMNVDADIYSNTAGAEVQGVTNAVLSNTVSAVVFAGSIGDTIWFDANNDGLLDAGEGLGGITVRITPPAGVDLGAGLGVPITTVTLPDGTYLFPNLPAGSYTIEVDESTLSVPLQGNNTVDPDGGNDSISVHVLGADEDNLDQDFAYFVDAGITLDKTVYVGHDGGASCPGSELALAPVTSDVTYCFVVTNTGGTYLDAIDITDADIGITQADLTLVSGTLPLAPATSATYFFDSTLSVDLVNTASVVANPTDENGVDLPGLPDPTDNDTAAVTAVAVAIDLQKTVYLNHNAGASCPGVELVTGTVGDNVTYCFVVTNTGETHLDAVDIVDTDIGVTQADLILLSGSLPLAPAASVTYYHETTMNGDLLNTASVSANPTDMDGNDLPGLVDPVDDDTAEVDSVGPAVDLQKTVYLDHNAGASCPGGELATATIGTNVTYCFVVTNTGDTHLDAVDIVDTNIGVTQGDLTLLSGSLPLAPSASAVYFYNGTLNSDLVNTASVSVNPTDSDGNDLPGLDNPTDTDTAEVDAVIIAIDLQKTVYLDHNSGASCPGGELTSGPVATDVTYCFVVTNTGETHLDAVNITDADIGVTQGDLTLLSGSLPLAPSASVTYYYDGTITTNLVNTASVSANPTDMDGNDLPGLTDPSDEDTAEVAIASASIDLQKSVYLNHNNGASCPAGELVTGASGTDVTYCFVVTNTGDTHLDAVNITDADIGVAQSDLTLLSGSLPLAPATSITYYYNGTLTADLVNTASVSANPTDMDGNDLPGITDPTDSDTAEVDLVGAGVDLQKTVYLNHNAGAGCPAGESVSIFADTPVTYCFVVTNTGDTYLDDIMLSDVTLGIDQTNMTLLSGTFPIAPNATAVYYYETTATTDLVNTANVTANPVDSTGTDIGGLPILTAIDDATVDLLEPEMSLEKSVYLGHDNGAGCPGMGQLDLPLGNADVTFCFTVTNTGDVDLDAVAINDITFNVTDADMILVSGSSPLAPTETMVWAYETNLSDSVDNTAHATANPIDDLGNDIPILIDEEDGSTAIVTSGTDTGPIMIPTLSFWSILLMLFTMLATGLIAKRKFV